MKPTGADITVAEQMLRIDHPSLRDLNNTIISHNTLISEYKDTKEFQTADAIQKRIDKGDDLILGPLQRNYDSHVSKIRALEEIRDKFQSLINDGSFFLGHVYAGSGMNRIRYNLKNAPITMDWALVEIGSYRLRTEGESVVGNVVSFKYQN